MLAPQGISLEININGEGDPTTVERAELSAEFGPGELPAYGEVLAGILDGKPSLRSRGCCGGPVADRDPGPRRMGQRLGAHRDVPSRLVRPRFLTQARLEGNPRTRTLVGAGRIIVTPERADPAGSMPHRSVPPGPAG